MKLTKLIRATSFLVILSSSSMYCMDTPETTATELKPHRRSNITKRLSRGYKRHSIRLDRHSNKKSGLQLENMSGIQRPRDAYLNDSSSTSDQSPGRQSSDSPSPKSSSSQSPSERSSSSQSSSSQEAAQISFATRILFEEYDIESIKELIKEGADIHAQDHFGDTLLHHTVIYPRPVILMFYLMQNVDPNKTNKEDITPLHITAGTGNVKYTELLIHYGAKPNVKDNKGRTPLHHAAIGGHANTVKTLLKNGAIPNIQDNEGHTPLDHSNTQKNEVPAILRYHMEKIGI